MDFPVPGDADDLAVAEGKAGEGVSWGLGRAVVDIFVVGSACGKATWTCECGSRDGRWRGCRGGCS